MLMYYLLIAIIIVFGLILGDNYKKQYVIFVCILLSIIAGFRHYTIGNDTIIYFRSFSDMALYGKEAFDISRFELGYSFFCLAFTRICKNFNVYLFVISLFINLSFGHLIIKYSKNCMYSLLLFILCRFYFSEMNIMRQMIAAGVLLYSIKYIEQKKLFKYVVLVIVSTLFHKSSILFLPVYFLYDFELKNVKKVYIFSLVILLFLFLNPVLTKLTALIGNYGNYIEKFMDSNRVASILATLIYLCEYLFVNYVKKKNIKDFLKIDNLFYNILVLGLVINFLAIRISVMERCAIYFEIFSIVTIPNFISKIKNPKNRLLWYVLFFIAFLIYFLVITYLRPNWNSINPYLFFWQ